MRRHNISIRDVVPHQHWLRIRYSDKKNLGYKNCPRFLLDNGRRGVKWKQFIDRVESYL